MTRKDQCKYVKRSSKKPLVDLLAQEVAPNQYTSIPATGQALDLNLMREEACGAPITPNSTCAGSPCDSQFLESAGNNPPLFDGYTPHVSGPVSESAAPISDIASIRDRWLYPYLDDSPARYAVMAHSMTFLCRVFRTYPRMTSRRNQLPPFMHPAQISKNVPLPLANCFTLSRMWEGRSVISDGDLMEATVGRELDRLFTEVVPFSSECVEIP